MRTISLFLFLFLFAAVLPAATVVEEIVARVGNDIITKSDLDRETVRLREELSRRLQGDELEKAFAEQQDKVLDFMINQRLLEQRAKELNIVVEDDIDAAVKRLREENQIPDDQALDSALRREGSSLQNLRDDFRRRIIQQRILWNYVQSKVNITEDEIKNYYEQHKSEMLTEPTTRIRRYIISSEESDPTALKGEADAVVDRLRQGGQPGPEEFPHLKIDENPTEFTKAEIDAKLVESIEATPQGEYTPPIEIASGWLILKIEERKEAQPIPMEEARGRVYNILLQQNAEKYQQSFLEDLRKQSYVVINTKQS